MIITFEVGLTSLISIGMEDVAVKEVVEEEVEEGTGNGEEGRGGEEEVDSPIPFLIDLFFRKIFTVGSSRNCL